jgi:topoisomerase-4 subunit A
MPPRSRRPRPSAPPLAAAEVIERPLGPYAEQAYLDYAMAVVLDRALPHLADGLKPVQRRIVYAMHELGLHAGAKPKKSARTVGDVIGKYHPHGDQAAYEAMVLMAQPFSFRYPLVDGQGNFGSLDDPGSFAAMRYTEARLSSFADVLLSELEQGTVDWTENFDGTLREPRLLPARLPHVLLNGASGIAVGMATDVPPHNLGEVADALVLLLERPRASLDEVLAHVRGPDYPSPAPLLVAPEDLRRLYAEGTGALRQRAAWHAEEHALVIDALPHQVNVATVLEGLARAVEGRRLPWIEDVRDESDREHPVRLVLALRGRADPDAVFAEARTVVPGLERTLRANFNMIGLDGRPAVKPLLTLLHEWLEFRRATVRRRLEWRRARIAERLAVLETYRRALARLEEVIAILRRDDDPRPALAALLDLAPPQVDALLEIRLRQLARLEERRLEEEHAALVAERDAIEALLADPRRIDRRIREEILSDRARHADPRRTPLLDAAQERARAPAPPPSATSEPLTVVLSEMGWIRAGKGHALDPRGLSFRTGDGFLAAARGRSRDRLVLLDDGGRIYNLPADALPSARGDGEPVTRRLALPPGARTVGLVLLREGGEALLAAEDGYGFVVGVDDLGVRARAGRKILDARCAARVFVGLEPRHAFLAFLAGDGRLLVLAREEVTRRARGRGVRLVALAAGATLLRSAPLAAGESLVLAAGEERLTLDPATLARYRGRRGGRGRPLPPLWAGRAGALRLLVPDVSGGD